MEVVPVLGLVSGVVVWCVGFIFFMLFFHYSFTFLSFFLFQLSS